MCRHAEISVDSVHHHVILLIKIDLIHRPELERVLAATHVKVRNEDKSVRPYPPASNHDDA